MKLSVILEPLLLAGVDAETILKTVRAFEAQQETVDEKSKEKARERWRRWKSKKDKSNVGKRLQTTANDSCAGDTRGLDNYNNNNITDNNKTKKAASLSDLQEFKANLEADCSPEQVDAFAKHRKAKNGQNSAYAAKLFRKDATACGLSLSEAIDMAISRGWLTVKPEYLAGRNRQTAPPKPKTIGEMFREDAIKQGIIPNGKPDNEPTGRVGTSDGSAEGGGSGVARYFALTGHELGSF